MKLSDCGRCIEHFLSEDQRYLIEACASVGAERGISALEMLRHYMSVYHFSGHNLAESGVLRGASRAISE